MWRVGIVTLFLIFDLANTAYLSNKNHHNNNINHIINALQKESWNVEEDKCFNITFSLLNGVKSHTLWATWIWDSIAHPTSTFYGSQHHLGGYDQCLKAPWIEKHRDLKTQYCLAEVKVGDVSKEMTMDFDPYGSVKEYFETKHHLNRELTTINYGACLPSACSTSSVTKIVQSLIASTHLGILNPEIKMVSCQNDGQELRTEVYVFGSILLILLAIAVVSTWFVEDKSSDTIVTSISNSFCMRRNLQNLFKVYENEIFIINILKTIFAICSACMHHFLFGMGVAPMNLLDFDKFLSSPVGSIFFHADVGVETFYTISGLFLVKSLYGSKKNPLKLILMRYIRLAAPFALMIFYTLSLSSYIGSGPIWDRTAGTEAMYCKKNWWLSVMMMNNYVRADEICQVTWYYIPTDFHMAVLGTIIIYLYKRGTIGNKSLALMSLVLVSLPGFVTYANGYQAMPFYDAKSILNPRQTKEYLDTYMKTHNRCGSYIVGMAMGYILSVYKPAKYRNVISEKQTTLIILTSLHLLLFIMASGGLILNTPYNPVTAGLYAVSSRVTWAVVICAIIAAAEYGTSSLITYLRNFSIFVPISRLSYCIYLTHTALLQRRWYATRSPYAFDLFSMIMDGAGMVSFTLAASLALWLLVEAPVGHIAGLLLDPKLKSKQITPEKSEEKLDPEQEFKTTEESGTPNESSHISTDTNRVRFRIRSYGS